MNLGVNAIQPISGYCQGSGDPARSALSSQKLMLVVETKQDWLLGAFV